MIEPLRATWGAKAVAGDTLDRVDNGARLLCIWISEDNGLHYSKTEMSPSDYAVLSAAVTAMNMRAIEPLIWDSPDD